MPLMAELQEHQQDAEPSDRNPADDQIRSRADLFKVYAGMPRHEMCLCFLEDTLLRKQIRILYYVTKPLHYEYAEHLRMQQGGSLDMLKWHAGRATGAPNDETIREILDIVSSPEMPRLLDLQPGKWEPLEIGEVPEEDARVTETLCNFALHLASNRAWSQTFFKHLLPYAATLVFAPDDQMRDVSDILRKSAQAMILIESCAKRAHSKSPVQELWQERFIVLCGLR